MELTQGQALALDQLNEIAGSSNGALEIADALKTAEDGSVWIQLSIETKSYKAQGGFAFRDREKLRMKVYPNFPFTAPSLNFSHNRFIGQPHVQWGSHICLYQSSETEWQPADGLYGFFERVDDWMAAAGRGQLDPDDAPLHPPVAYPSSNTRFVFTCDAPTLGANDVFWIGRAELEKKREGRFDVTGWVALEDWNTADQSKHVAAAVLLSKPLPMEYPDTIDGLQKTLERNGVSFDLFYALLKVFAAKVPRDNPTYVIVGAPMRRKEAGAPLRQHLKAWEIDAIAVNALHDIVFANGDKDVAIAELAKWMVTAKTRWCKVFENRPEVTNRRDSGSLLAWIEGKRILLLGCGALGSAVAEHLVRAGAKSLILSDNGIVSPGLLVRQRYSDRDVGFAKASCLAQSLNDIGFSTEIEVDLRNLATGVIDKFDLRHVDLIINATASGPVAHAIECDLKRISLFIPFVSLSVSAAAQCGSVVVKMPGFHLGTIAIDRLTKIGMMKENANHPAVRAFWPQKSERTLFQPEPGCSEPTFTGSSADLGAFAAILLNIGLRRTLELKRHQACTDLVSAPWAKLRDPGALHLTLDSQSKANDQRHGFEVLTSRTAQKGILAEIRRIGRTRSKKVETGGLIFGHIDEAHNRIFVDSVTGPPPDSEASEEKFLCGISGTREIGAAKSSKSGGSSRFIGIWHTHPISRGQPSTDDLCAMAELLHFQEFPPRHVVMLIVGFAATMPQFNYYLFHRRDIQVVAQEDLIRMLEAQNAS